MTDEQNPTGDQPPQDPTQPLSGSTPPPADPPPPPPVNPYETPAAAPPPPSEQPPPPPADTPAPPYGTPPPAAPQYGTPQYATPAPYGSTTQPGYPAGAVEDKPGRGLAIAAFVVSLFICLPYVTALVAVVLAVVVLLTGRRGKGLAIAAIVIAVISSVLWTALFVAIGNGALDDAFESLAPVENLKTGECLNASNLTDDEADFVEKIEEKSCDDPHDAEVLATKTLTQDEAEAYDAATSTLCVDLVTADGSADKIGEGMDLLGLTTDADPDAGDHVVCITYNLDGSKLDGPL